MKKIDFKKEFKSLYSASKRKPVFVEVPEMNFLMIDGKGDPNIVPEFQAALDALYPVSYSLKFMSKKELNRDYVVMPLEGLWWADDLKDFANGNKENWKWTLMIMQPEFIEESMIKTAIKETKKKKDLPAMSKIRYEKYEEGFSVQIMHVGAYSEETLTIKKLHHFAKEKGYLLRRKHHEIYLSDPRRTKPERLRTILRQPLKNK